MTKPSLINSSTISMSESLRRNWIWIVILVGISFALLHAENIQAAIPAGVDGPPYEVVVTIAASPDPAIAGQLTSIQVKVTALDTSLVPTGIVEVMTGALKACMVSLDSAGEGACTLTFPSEGVAPLKAIYSGETPFLPGVSGLLELQVQLPFPNVTMYESNFETPVGSEWCLADISTAPNGQTFLGEFNNTTNCLSLENLPQHNWAQVSFDLYILRSWDGNQVEFDSTQIAERFLPPNQPDTIVGPDEWSVQVNGEPPLVLLHTTFSNWTLHGLRQAFPGVFKVGDYPAQTGAIATSTLGYTFVDLEMDAIYHLKYTFAHSASSLGLEFKAQGLQAIEDESWGLDNLVIRVNNMPLNRTFIPFVNH